MSWIKHHSTGTQPAPYIDKTDDKVADPSGIKQGRMVSNKKANKPFLSYARYRERREAEHLAWLERKKAHEEKVAKGIAKGPFTERDPTEVKEVSLTGFFKFLIYCLIFGMLAGKFFMNSWTWGVDVMHSKWLKIDTYIPRNERLFTEEGLAQFDGSVLDKPIYLAIDGDVYDVTTGAAYQPGGSYHHFAGVDGARAFATGCFKEHLTHDLRGLSEQDLAAIKHWKEFYANHKDYFKVGRVLHRPIDPASPIPEDCNKSKKRKDKKKEGQWQSTKTREGQGQDGIIALGKHI